MLLPEFFDAFVGRTPFRLRRSPILKDFSLLRRRPPRMTGGYQSPNSLGERIGNRLGRGRQRQPHASQVAVLIVVTIPAPVLLRQVKRQDDFPGNCQRLCQREDSLPGQVAPHRADVETPGCVFFAVDGELDRTGNPLVIGAVIEHRLQRLFRRIDVRSGLGKPKLLHLAGALRRRSLHAKFTQRRQFP